LQDGGDADSVSARATGFVRENNQVTHAESGVGRQSLIDGDRTDLCLPRWDGINALR
jgi:hypothetical protein